MRCCRSPARCWSAPRGRRLLPLRRLRRRAPAAGGARDPAADADRARHVAPGRHRAPVRDRVLPHRRAHHDPLQRRQPRRPPCSRRCTRWGTASTRAASNGDTTRTPLCRPVSLGMHESQSRTWENLVGRSRAVLAAASTSVVEAHVPRAARRRRRRTTSTARSTRSAPRWSASEADELTYDLHVLLRFELERAMFAGGLDPRRPARGVERAHARVPRHRRADRLRRRAAGRALGRGPVRLLPDLLARQHHRRAAVGGGARGAARPGASSIERGELAPLREWLREHVHRHGRKLESAEIVERATGRPIEIGPYVRYLRKKYGEIYGLEAADQPRVAVRVGVQAAAPAVGFPRCPARRPTASSWSTRPSAIPPSPRCS